MFVFNAYAIKDNSEGVHVCYECVSIIGDIKLLIRQFFLLCTLCHHANGVAKQANNIIIIIHVKVVKFVFNKGSSLVGFQEKWFFLSYSPLNHNLLF